MTSILDRLAYLVGTIESPVFSDWSTCALVDAYCIQASKTGRDASLESAHELAKGIKDNFHRAEALSSLAIAEALIGSPRDANRLLHSSLDALASVDTALERIDALEAIVEAATYLGNVDDINVILKRIVKLGKSETATPVFRTAASISVSRGYLALGNIESSQDALRESLKEIRNVPSSSDRSMLFASAATAMGSLGAMCQNAELIEEAYGVANFSAIEQYRSNALLQIVSSSSVYAALSNDPEQLENALEATKEIWRRSDLSNTLSVLAGAFKQAGRTRSASELLNMSLVTARRIQTPTTRIVALVNVAAGYATLSDFELADSTLLEAFGDTIEIANKADLVAALLKITRGYLALGSPDDATVTLTEADYKLGTVPAKMDRIKLLAEIAQRWLDLYRMDLYIASIERSVSLIEALDTDEKVSFGVRTICSVFK